MQTFTGWQYLLIDVANNHHAGLDKKTFDERLQWAEAHLDILEDEAQGHIWKQRPLYLKACMAVRKAQQGIPTGHMVGFDAVCSGMQIMSVLTGCFNGANATGLIDPNRRADAYTDCTNIMSRALGRVLPNMRKSVKNAVMTCLYGSKKEPEKEFGEGTDELNTFYQAMYKLCPGACDLLQILLDSWRPYSKYHSWKLPDGFDVKVKVMVKREAKIEVDELNHSTFNYVWYENWGTERDVKNAANVIHSVDAYILRSLVRRCSYDRSIAEQAYDVVTDVLLTRALGQSCIIHPPSRMLEYYQEQYRRSSVADPVILPHLTWNNAHALSTEHLQAIKTILESMLCHQPFDIVTVHDDFKCHPNHMNWLRMHYRNILAELADSNLLDDLLSQLYGQPAQYQKKDPNLSRYIHQSNYALC